MVEIVRITDLIMLLTCGVLLAWELIVLAFAGIKSRGLISHWTLDYMRENPHLAFGAGFLFGHLFGGVECDVPGITAASGLFIVTFIWDIIAHRMRGPRFSELYPRIARSGFGLFCVAVAGVFTGRIVWPQGIVE